MRTPGSIKTRELIGCETHPSGSVVRQLTGAPMFHSNIYCEMPFSDPEGRYVIYQRSPTAYGPWEVWRADLSNGDSVFVAEEVVWTGGCGMSPDQRYFYCVRLDPQAAALTIIRTEIATLKQTTVLFHNIPGPRLGSMGAISRDHRYYYAASRLGHPRDHRFGVLKFDLQEGDYEVILEGGDDLCNMHVQIDPGGEDLLIQHNRGAVIDDEGNVLKLVTEPFCTLFLIDTNGGNRRELPIGKPYTRQCQGHQAWIGNTGEIIATISFNPDPEFPEKACLLRLKPGDEKCSVISDAADFCHPNASRDGRFFVSDEWRDKTVVVGSLKTGRTRVLCETGSSFRGNQWTHPHPYFTPGNGHVVFNSDRTGIPHVYAASVPEGLLEELEG